MIYGTKRLTFLSPLAVCVCVFVWSCQFFPRLLRLVVSISREFLIFSLNGHGHYGWWLNACLRCANWMDFVVTSFLFCWPILRWARYALRIRIHSPNHLFLFSMQLFRVTDISTKLLITFDGVMQYLSQQQQQQHLHNSSAKRVYYHNLSSFILIGGETPFEGELNWCGSTSTSWNLVNAIIVELWSCPSIKASGNSSRYCKDKLSLRVCALRGSRCRHSRLYKHLLVLTTEGNK